MKIVDHVLQHARTKPNKTAIIDAEERVTYQQLSELCVMMADKLFELGIGANSLVGFFGNPSAEYVYTLLGTHFCSASWLGLNPKYTSRELEKVLDCSMPELIIVDKTVNEKQRNNLCKACGASPNANWIVNAKDILCKTNANEYRSRVVPFKHIPDDTALIVFTSGSTGRPKGACIRHEGMVTAAQLYVDRYQLDSPTQLLNLPINHVGAVVDITAPNLLIGGTLVMQQFFDPSEVHRLLEQEKVSVLGLVPAQYLAIDEVKRLNRVNYPGLEHLIWSGSSMPTSWIEEHLDCGIEMSTCYGLTESTGSVTFTSANANLTELATTVGSPANIEWVRIVNDGIKCEAGERGEIQIRGPLMMSGYLNDDNASEQAFTFDGWLRTGDVGYFTVNDEIVLCGRQKEMFKSGGYNVFPQEIEVVLESHPQVISAAVVSTEHPKWGEVGVAYIVSSGKLTASDLKSWCQSNLSNYKIPKRFIFKQFFPLLPIGKVDKLSLKKQIKLVDDYYD